MYTARWMWGSEVIMGSLGCHLPKMKGGTHGVNKILNGGVRLCRTLMFFNRARTRLSLVPPGVEFPPVGGVRLRRTLMFFNRVRLRQSLSPPGIDTHRELN
jgi:hypothetical protein